MTKVFDSLALALAYLDRCFYTRYIFPIKAGAKFPPCLKDNLEGNCSNEPAQIIAWARKFPGCNWGVAHRKSGLLVVDVDTNVNKGKVGQATFDALDLEYGWPATEETTTPSGGHHHIYLGWADDSHPEHIMALGVNGIGKDIDSPNYTLIPGCMFKDGTTYVGNGAEPVRCPEWVYDLIKSAKTRQRVANAGEIVVELDQEANIEAAIAFLQEDAEPAIEGEGGDFKTLKTAMYLKDLAISENLAADLLNEYYNPRCSPAWTMADLEKKVTNAWNYSSLSKVGGKTAEADFDEVNEDEEPLPPPKNPAEKKAREKAQKDAKTRALKREAEKQLPDDQRERIWTRQEVMDEFVWITGIERFIEKNDTRTVWKRSMFDAHFLYLPSVKKEGTKSLTEILLRLKKGTIRRFKDITYKPGLPQMVDGKFNMYVQPDIIPAEGDITWWDDHLAYLFPDPVDRDHVLNWMAWLLQNISLKPKHALLVAGSEQGTGKSFLVEVLARILHKNNVATLSQNDLHGDFNGWAIRSKLLAVEELRAIDRTEVANKLHPLITQDMISVNEKNLPQREAENCFGVFAMTNSDAAITLDPSDRRYLVVRTEAFPRFGKGTPASITYYDTLYARLGNVQDMAAVFYSLMKRDLKGYTAAGAAPLTEAKSKMIEAGLSDLEHFVMEKQSEFPFTARMISINDIIDILPKRLEGRSARLSATLKSILLHRLKAVELGQCPVGGGRARLYALKQTAILSNNSPLINGRIYEADKKTAGKGSDLDDAENEFSGSEAS